VTPNEVMEEVKKLNAEEEKKYRINYAHAVADLNEYIVVSEGGRVRIQHTKDESINWPYKEAELHFKNLYVSKVEYKINTANTGWTPKTHRIQIFEDWFISPLTTRYHKIVFKPNIKTAHIKDDKLNYFNKWRGFAYVFDVNHYPPTATCKKYLKLIKEVICDDNEEAYEWLLDWIADLFQHPEEKNGVAISLYSEKMGNGKTTFVEMLIEMLKPYAIKISAMDLIDRFNAQLRNKLLVFIDENQFFSGREIWNKMKNYITSTTIPIEEKGVNKIQVEHYARFVFAANEKRNVTIETDNRRYVPIHCLEQAYEVSFFESMWKEMKNGGYGVFTDMMLKRDITKRKWRPIPIFDDTYVSNRLNTLQIENPTILWAYHWLIEKDLVALQNPSIAAVGSKIFNETLWECYCQWAENSRIYKDKGISKDLFHESLKKIVEPQMHGSDGSKRYIICSAQNLERMESNTATVILGDIGGVYFAEKKKKVLVKNRAGEIWEAKIKDDEKINAPVKIEVGNGNELSEYMKNAEGTELEIDLPDIEEIENGKRQIGNSGNEDRGDILEENWNPIIGCEKYSEGCVHCWWLDRRLPQLQEEYKKYKSIDPNAVTSMGFSEKELSRKSGIIGICQHGDLFWDKVSDEKINKVLDSIENVARSKYSKYVLWTKRAERMAKVMNARESVSEKIACAVSVENQSRMNERLPHLLHIPTTKILVLEPLLQEVTIGPDIKELDWVIVGSETGDEARQLDKDWVRKVRDEALAAKVPLFVKQLGTSHTEQERDLDGTVWGQRPKGFEKRF
jgi:protein gp37